jgi:Fe-S-cluster-containing dehydrogenase component/DMSO reductase anchor subunit
VSASLQRLPALKRAPKTAPEPGNLIDQLLAEQKQLQTPVARFSEKHHKRQPDLAPHYRSLIPLTQPGSGEQYAFEVSLDRCTGCKACVSACHSLNGLDDHEVWRDTGVLLGGEAAPQWQQTVTTACHHCADPACMNGCPVGAYEKDAHTGIVHHLDDQCIGCSYCILKCPYDVPKYSKKRGIVRKCDMCHQRLAEGEAPACVQACPTEAIRIIKVPTALPPETHHSLLGDVSITLPTTRYTGRILPESAVAADHRALIPQHAHWPLVLMLTLTQAGLGLLLTPAAPAAITYVGSLLFFAGMAASVFHLGQPLKAWRFFLGLKTSWLSREILAFSLFAPLPFLLCVLPLLPDFPFKSLASHVTALATPPLGLLAVFTSVMIYHDTRRSLWRFPLSATRFFGTVAALAMLGNFIAHPSPSAAWLFALVSASKTLPELAFLRRALTRNPAESPDLHSARLQLGPLRNTLKRRLALAFLAIPAALVSPWLALPILLLAEVHERLLFFQSVRAPKMPGNFGPENAH